MPPDARTTPGLRRDVLAASQRYYNLRMAHSTRIASNIPSTPAQHEDILKAKIDLQAQEFALQARVTLQDELVTVLTALARQLRELALRVEDALLERNTPPSDGNVEQTTN